MLKEQHDREKRDNDVVVIQSFDDDYGDNDTKTTTTTKHETFDIEEPVKDRPGLVIRSCCHCGPNGNRCLYILSRIMLLIMFLAALAAIAFILTYINTWIIVTLETSLYEKEYNVTTGCPLIGPCTTNLKCHKGNLKECYIYGFALFAIECIIFAASFGIGFCIYRNCRAYDALCKDLGQSSHKGEEHTE